MHAAALQVDLDPDRLSFVRSLHIIQDAVPEFQMVAPEQRGQLYQRLLRDLARKQLPERQARSNPRVVKRKMSNFKLKRKEHAHPPKLERPFREVVALQTTLPAADHGSSSADESLMLELSPRRKLADQPFVDVRQLELCLI